MTPTAPIHELTREQLLSVVDKQHIVIAEREEKIDCLQHRVSELERLIFGVKSERFVAATGSEQGHLDFGSSTEQQPEAPATETITYEREKLGGNKKPSRQLLPAHLYTPAVSPPAALRSKPAGHGGIPYYNIIFHPYSYILLYGCKKTSRSSQ